MHGCYFGELIFNSEVDVNFGNPLPPTHLTSTGQLLMTPLPLSLPLPLPLQIYQYERLFSHILKSFTSEVFSWNESFMGIIRLELSFTIISMVLFFDANSLLRTTISLLRLLIKISLSPLTVGLLSCDYYLDFNKLYSLNKNFVSAAEFTSVLMLVIVRCC